MCLPCRNDTEMRCHIRSDSQHVSAMAALEVFINLPLCGTITTTAFQSPTGAHKWKIKSYSRYHLHLTNSSNMAIPGLLTRPVSKGRPPSRSKICLSRYFLPGQSHSWARRTAQHPGLCATRHYTHCRARHWVPPALREQQGNVPIPALPAVLLLVFLPRGTASTQWACKFLHPGSALCCSEQCLGLRGTTSPGHLRVPWLRGSGTATCPGLHWDLCHLLLILTRHCAAGKNIGGNQRWFFSCRHPVIS